MAAAKGVVVVAGRAAMGRTAVERVMAARAEERVEVGDAGARCSVVAAGTMAAVATAVAVAMVGDRVQAAREVVGVVGVMEVMGGWLEASRTQLCISGGIESGVLVEAPRAEAAGTLVGWTAEVAMGKGGVAVEVEATVLVVVG